MKKDFNWVQLWAQIKKYMLNKYVLVLIVFALVMLFLGDQSVLQDIKRQREINHLKEQRDAFRAGIRESQREIETLQNVDSLERFAREHYYMHTPEEDVYLIQEK